MVHKKPLLFSLMVILVCFFLFFSSSTNAQNSALGNTSTGDEHTQHTADKLKQSVDFSPLSPLFNIYAIHYNRHLTPKDEIILGSAYARIPFDFGHTNSISLIIGYRRYLWKNLHVDYQLWPDYDWFYEKNEDKVYKGFDLWNEFRLGYLFDFEIEGQPCYINFQWPFGFGLYAQNKPASFKEHEKENKYFYFPPMFFLGVRF